jgi:hypothetical protein
MAISKAFKGRMEQLKNCSCIYEGLLFVTFIDR